MTERSRRALDQADTNWDLPVGKRKFRRVLRQVAERGDKDRLADARHGHAELRGQVQARPDQDFGAAHVGVDARVAHLRQPRISWTSFCALLVTWTGLLPTT